MQILSELRRLNNNLEASRGAETVEQPITQADRNLVGALSRAVGIGRVFAAREIARRPDPMLKEVLKQSALTDARRLGMALARLQRRDINGLEVLRTGVDANGAVWVFSRTGTG
jgi:hypothetical protein